MQSEFGDQRSARFLSEPEQLACPRCYSTNTKFCYYNNYNLSQPRHRCKSCRRYWTRGGTLRNVPVGGGTHRNTNKRSRTTSTPPSSSSVLSSNPVPSDLIQVDTRADTTSFFPSSVGEKSDCDTWEGRRVEIGLDGGDGDGCTDLAISTPAKALN